MRLFVCLYIHNVYVSMYVCTFRIYTNWRYITCMRLFVCLYIHNVYVSMYVCTQMYVPLGYIQIGDTCILHV